MNTLRFIKTDICAVTPTRAHPTDIGYDLSAISVWKVLSDQTIIFDTGIAVQPPIGKYIEILPRSSITKTGMMLANSVGTIDPDYLGSLKIAVRLVDPELGIPDLPFCKFQLVMRTADLYEVEEVYSFTETERGDGAFGSTW
jgi:dUTP pyrophosphatase